jgi:hypothetical protein
MRKFKIHYPVPLLDDSVIDDNVDLNIILESGDVFFGLAMTPENIRKILNKKEYSYFWTTDFIVLPDLQKATIRIAVEEALGCGEFDSIFTPIGDLSTVFDHREWRFEDIYDPTFTG